MPWHEDAPRAAVFIEDSVKEGKPFFINVWLHEPHTPFHTLPKYEWRFRHLENREDQIYASVLSHADDRIGQLLDTLDRLGIADNTLVIFSSDNGPARSSENVELDLYYDTATGAGWNIAAAKGITGGRRGYKGALFEGGVGVPFIARWPNKIASGKIDDVSLISAVDLLPTFCELAGAQLPPDYEPDGISIVEVLKGQTRPSREKPLFWKIDAPWPKPVAKPDHWVAWAVVHDRWKLVANRDLTHTELYAIDTDVSESSDVKAANTDVAANLLARLKAWQSTLPENPIGEVFSKLRDSGSQN
jgi:N-acetylgalactosamine-6-sulfatase